MTGVRKRKSPEKRSEMTIARMVIRKLKKIDHLTFLEKYAYFMGKTQIIETYLKALLVKNFKYTEKRVEKKTLGQSITELGKKGLREDLLEQLKELLEYRNSLAHEFLSTTAIGTKIAGNAFIKLQAKELNHALYKVEETTLIIDFLSKGKLFK